MNVGVKLCFLLGLSLTMTMEATYSSETSVDFQRTTWPYIPEGNVFEGCLWNL
jgi:hypothetical protein